MDNKEVPHVSTDFVLCLTLKGGFHRVHYRQYCMTTDCSSDQEVVICVHGLTRNSRDFDFLAEKIARIKNEEKKYKYRVICVDVVGRGNSDYIEPSNYNYNQYMHDMVTLIARVTEGQNIDKGVIWIGSSMGGILGIMVAAQRNTFIKKMVLNDAPAYIRKEALVKISQYVKLVPKIETIEEAENYFKKIYAKNWGPTMNDSLFRHVAIHGVKKENESKNFKLNYDIGICEIFSAPDALEKDVDLFPVWDNISLEIPILLLHGEDSDVLTKEVAEKMKSTKNVTLIDYKETAHLPPLMTDSDINDVIMWMESQL